MMSVDGMKVDTINIDGSKLENCNTLKIHHQINVSNMVL
jgi:hypothetical protein